MNLVTYAEIDIGQAMEARASAHPVTDPWRETSKTTDTEETK